MTGTRDTPPTGPPGDGWIDRQRFARVAQECEWTVGELAEFYLEGTRDQLRDIHRALTAGDTQEVIRLAHGCVGSSSTCGVDALTELFSSLEQAGRDGRMDSADELARLAEERLSQISAALDRLGDS